MEDLDRAVRLVEEANAGLAPGRCSRTEARRLLGFYVRLEKLAAYGKTALAARPGDATELAKVAGTSVGSARRTIETGRRMAEEPRLADAAARAEVSLDQAEVIARTTDTAPDSLDGLLDSARNESFHALRDRARAVRLGAEDRTTLTDRQHRARRLRHWVGDLGMIHIDGALEPHVGAPLVQRLEHEGRRLAASSGGEEPFERHLADALPAITTGTTTASAKAEVVVLVSHEITRRGWTDTRDGEHCKIPGIGPIPPHEARRIAQDAFLNALFYDGEDLRLFKRWTRNIPPPVRIALQLGPPPSFDGPRCIDCGNRHHLETDHTQPLSRGGPTAVWNIQHRCLPCHHDKTARERRTPGSGKTTPSPHPVPQALPLPP